MKTGDIDDRCMEYAVALALTSIKGMVVLCLLPECLDIAND